jgi:outer membrane protein insertion porin family
MHLGGPTSVRMFRPNAMGPKDSGMFLHLVPICLLILRVSGIGDFMGGDLHWSTGLSLLAPIPKRPDWPVKCHMFVNAGRLIRLDSS